MEDKTKMIAQSAVLSRPGWSGSILVKLLGEPDLRKKQYGRANLMCLYCLDRAQSAEASELFCDAQESLTKRKLSAKKAVETKVGELMGAVSRMPVNVKRVTNCFESKAMIVL